MIQWAGKLRGIVVDNADPQKLGRLKVFVPGVYGESQPAENLPWAWPCFPSGGSDDCGFFKVPEIGACVWIELQWTDGQPDPSYPVWTGVWVKAGATPEDVHVAAADAHYYTVVKNAAGGSTLVLCDKPGAEFAKIRHKTGAMIVIDAQGNIILHPAAGAKIKGLKSYPEVK